MYAPIWGMGAFLSWSERVSQSMCDLHVSHGFVVIALSVMTLL
jgi:hypothetical protein